MIEKLADMITDVQIKSPMKVISAFMLITLLLLPGIFNLIGNVEASLEKVLPSDVDEVKIMNNMRSQFGADMMYIVLYSESPLYDVRNPKMLLYIDLIAQKLRTRDYIISVDTLADLVKSNEKLPLSLSESKELLSVNPLYMQYTNNDYSLTVIRIKSDTGASASSIKSVVVSIKNDMESLENYNPGSTYHITGFNAIDKATFEVIISDFVSITLISMALVAAVVIFTFRSLKKAMMPMLVVLISLIWTLGIVGYIGLTITVVSMVAAAMILGLGIDFGIHVVHTYYHLRNKHGREKSLKGMLSELLRAMLGASFTTVSGFLALLFGVLPAMKTLGIILAIGILSTLAASVFLLPTLVYVYDSEPDRKVETNVHKNKKTLKGGIKK